jgi:hypothetical protein
MGLFALAEESSAVIDELIDQGPDPGHRSVVNQKGRASGTALAETPLPREAVAQSRSVRQ